MLNFYFNLNKTLLILLQNLVSIFNFQVSKNFNVNIQEVIIKLH